MAQSGAPNTLVAFPRRSSKVMNVSGHVTPASPVVDEGPSHLENLADFVLLPFRKRKTSIGQHSMPVFIVWRYDLTAPTFELLHVTQEEHVRVLHLQVELDRLQKDSLQDHHFLLQQTQTHRLLASFSSNGGQLIPHKKWFARCTLGSSPNWANCTSLSKLRAVLMMSLHFLGVSSTLPARKRQQAPVTSNTNTALMFHF